MKSFGFNFDTTYLGLPDALYTKLAPQPVTAPKLIILNQDLSTELGLNFTKENEDQQTAILSGNQPPEGTQPFAQAYAGHQFGHFTILGDGRAHILGEHINPNNQRFDIQLKGSGRTPYSRRGDGRAALGPMLREYIISEAMHALNIPTTRSLAVVTTGEEVFRETPLPGAILTRIASSHIRVGTFEFAATQEDSSLLEALLEYTINRHTPEIKDAENKAIALLDNVMDRQIDLITNWMRIGFIHGVMNTDNMTISGETIDYGPCAFMDAYDANTVLSSIDHMGRYAYANQPVMAQWNLSRLAGALLPVIDTNEDKAVRMAKDSIAKFPELYKRKWLTMMRAKLGLFDAHKDDETLVSDLLNWMHSNHADFTNTFRALSHEDRPTQTPYNTKPFKQWYERWQNRLSQNKKPLKSSLCLMKNNNPAIIPRNHKVEEALEAANTGNFEPFHNLLSALKSPYSDSPDIKPYQSPPAPDERVYQTFCGT